MSALEANRCNTIRSNQVYSVRLEVAAFNGSRRVAACNYQIPLRSEGAALVQQVSVEARGTIFNPHCAVR